mmetsp:Transcript_143751/g.250915  ORF Transcript_143751/g.250915 Transcript_143751/m.250915 type:complete len:309 (-) Transcript_143751:788-1714(-)
MTGSAAPAAAAACLAASATLVAVSTSCFSASISASSAATRSASAACRRRASRSDACCSFWASISASWARRASSCAACARSSACRACTSAAASAFWFLNASSHSSSSFFSFRRASSCSASSSPPPPPPISFSMPSIPSALSVMVEISAKRACRTSVTLVRGGFSCTTTGRGLTDAGGGVAFFRPLRLASFSFSSSSFIRICLSRSSIRVSNRERSRSMKLAISPAVSSAMVAHRAGSPALTFLVSARAASLPCLMLRTCSRSFLHFAGGMAGATLGASGTAGGGLSFSACRALCRAAISSFCSLCLRSR